MQRGCEPKKDVAEEVVVTAADICCHAAVVLKTNQSERSGP